MTNINSVIKGLILVVGWLGLGLGIEASQWTEDSYEDFRDGSFLDAGSNLYVSAQGRIQLISRWDLNGDGFLDVLMPAGHGYTEKENTYIYLNNGKDLDGRAQIELPGNGSSDGLVHDFNKDGLNDLAVANRANSHWKQVNSYIYYGAEEGFTVKNRTELPAYEAVSMAAGDFNGDSWTDLAIACQWQAGEPLKLTGPRMSFIYWNSANGFQEDRRLPLTFGADEQAQSVVAGNLDNDAIDDLVVSTENTFYIYYSTRDALKKHDRRVSIPVGFLAGACGRFNTDSMLDLAICTTDSLTILYGRQDGFRLEEAIRHPVNSPRDVAATDCDGDGLDDVIVANHQSPGGATWTDSYVYFSNGRDFTSRERLDLPTLGASGVSAGDFNGDGLPELVFSHQAVANVFSPLSYVYWNDGGSFRFGHHTQLETRGSVANAIGDVNNDGKPDVIYFNNNGGFGDGPVTSRLYWGDGTRNFNAERCFEFSSFHIFGVGHADLDDDGYVDMVLSQLSFLSGVSHRQSGLVIYWGNSEGFHGPSRLGLEYAYGGVRIADLNRDGYLDLVTGGHGPDPGDRNSMGLTIFWGSQVGFTHHDRRVIDLGTKNTVCAPLVMDFNRDGYLDIVGQVTPTYGKLEHGRVTIWWGGEADYSNENSTDIDPGRVDRLMYIQGADFNKDGWLDMILPNRGHGDTYAKTSFLYYGSPEGFSNNHRKELVAYAPYDNSVADYDRDGWLDIFLCTYGAVIGNQPSLIYWGSPGGFDRRPATELPTNGSSGAESADYDGDGWLDILVANHRQGGYTDRPVPHRHITTSMLYWGGPNGFSPRQRWDFKAVGPSGLNVRDVGNSYDRGLYEDYISSPHPIPAGEKPSSIQWDAETPHQTKIKFQLRVASSLEKLQNSAWHGPEGTGTWFTQSGSRIDGLVDGWIQYRARLMTPNGGPSPYLTKVTLSFE